MAEEPVTPTRDLKKFCYRSGFLMAPFILWLVLEVFFLPLTTFTFRPFEAIANVHFSWGGAPQLLPGRKYPGISVTKMSRGNLDFRDDPELKSITWVNDRRGLRNRPRPDPKDGYEFVIFGDSNIVGSMIDQKDTLSEVMERKCRCPVYNYGWGSWAEFVDDDYFRNTPPRFIVYELRRYGDIRQLRHQLRLDKFNGKIQRHPWYGRIPVKLVIWADQFLKQPAAHFVRARLGAEDGWRWHQEKIGQFKTRHQVDSATIPRELENEALAFDRIIRELENEALAFDRIIRAMGSRFVFLLMPPDRGTTPNDRRYDKFVRNLKARGVLVVGFLPDKQWPKGYPDWFWQKYDSHWTDKAIELTAKKIFEESYGTGWDKKSKY